MINPLKLKMNYDRIDIRYIYIKTNQQIKERYLEIITEDVSKKDTTFIQEKTKVLIHDFVPNKE